MNTGAEEVLRFSLRPLRRHLSVHVLRSLSGLREESVYCLP